MGDYTRIILRQGPDKDRKRVILKSGEPAFVTDYQRIVVGDGVTQGGVTIGSKFLGFVEFDSVSNEVFNATPGYPGDIVFETTSNLMYILSGGEVSLGKEAYQIKTNYVEINKTPSPDNINLYNNNGVLSLIQDSIDARYLATFAIGKGLTKNPLNNSILEMKDPSPELSFDGGTLQLTDGGVENIKLAPMRPNTVKARVNLSGPPEDITFDELKFALGLIAEGGGLTFGVPVGTIIDFAGPDGKAPPNYLPCDGRELPVNDYFELFDAIGNTWGAPTLTSFSLPNLNKRTTIGKGSLSGTGASDFVNERLGSYGGSLANQLTVKQLPPHIHGLQINIPAHKHEFTVTIPRFSGVYEAGSLVTNGYNNYIIIIGGNGPDAAPPTTPRGPTDSLTTIRSQAASIIKSQKSYIQQRTVDYVYDNFPIALSASSTTAAVNLSSKCFRDTGYIVDSIAADLLNNANHRAVETGNLYFSGYINSFQQNTTVPALPGNQVLPTIAAIENIGSIIAGTDIVYTLGGNYTNNGVLSSLTFLNPIQTVAIGGLRNFTNVISNSAFVPVTTPNGVVPFDTNNTYFNAGSAILQNKQNIQQRIVEFVKYNFPYALSAENAIQANALSARCYRDTGYIVDSIVADIRNNANHRSVETGQFYFSGAILLRNQIVGSTVPTLPFEQVNATIQAISAVGKLINGYLMPTEQNYTTLGVLSSDIYFTASQNIMLSSFNNFTRVISNSADIPVTTPLGTRLQPVSSYDLAVATLAPRREEIQNQIVQYTLFKYPYALSSSALFGISAADISITNAGSGYTTPPTVLIQGGGVNVTRVAKFVADINTTNFTVTAIRVLDAGVGYTDSGSITAILIPSQFDNIIVPAGFTINSLSEVVAANAMGLTAKCFRDTGFIFDAILADINNASNHRSVETGQFYFSGAVLSRNVNVGSTVPTLPLEEVEATIQAISAIGRYITGDNFPQPIIEIPIPYVVINAPIFDAGNEAIQRNDAVWNCINAMIYPLQNNGASLAYSPAGNPTSEDIELGNALLQNRTSIQKTVSSYVLKKNYLTIDPYYFEVFTNKCIRDTGYMIDAVANDLITGVNAKSIQYAVAYWDGSTSRLPEEILINQKQNTLDVIRYLRSASLEVAVSESATVENRIFKKVSDLVATMIYPLKNNGNNLNYFPPGSPIQNAQAAANLLLFNKATIQDKVSRYVQVKGYLDATTQPELFEKCTRDVGFMIDAIASDLISGVNAKSIQYALAYWDGSTTRLPQNELPNQRRNTIDTIEYLISVVMDYLKTYGGILNQILDLAKTVAFPLRNNGQLPPYEPQGPTITLDRDIAFKTLQANRTRLQNDTINFVRTLGIISDRPDLQAKCFRDIGYMVDSVINDLIYGTDARSIQYGLAYWDGTKNRIGGIATGVNSNVDQRAATIETIRFLRDQSIDLILRAGGNNPGGATSQTGQTSLSGAINYSGQTFDGQNGDLYGIENDPIGNIQPVAVVNKIIKVR